MNEICRKGGWYTVSQVEIKVISALNEDFMMEKELDLNEVEDSRASFDV